MGGESLAPYMKRAPRKAPAAKRRSKRTPRKPADKRRRK